MTQSSYGVLVVGDYSRHMSVNYTTVKKLIRRLGRTLRACILLPLASNVSGGDVGALDDHDMRSCSLMRFAFRNTVSLRLIVSAKD